MPTTKFKIVKKGDQFCVADDSGDPIQGGKGSCHANRADAVKQLRAIYAQKGKTFSEKSLYVPVKQFSATLDAAVGKDELPWIQIFPFGHWSHPVYGEDAAVVSYDRAARYVKNFNDNVRRQDIAIDYEHGEDKAKGNKASGWYRAMELRDDGVYAQIEFTEPAKQEIKNGEWRYFSPLFVDLYEDAETNEVFEDVIIGGGLTNRPWMKDMVPINFSEAVLEEKTIKYRFKDGRWIASDNDGENWRTATEAEVADLEHSEPGTGDPPQPRTDEEDRSGDEDGQGIRRDTPPPQDKKEGSDMKLSADALKLLGLDENADEAAVEDAIKTSFAQLPELKEFAEKNAKAKKFSEEFPEEFKRMQELALAEAGRASKAFAETYERVTHTEVKGDDKVVSKTNRGPSAIVLSGIETFHKKFSEGDATIDDFKGLMDTIFTDKAFVDYGEVGSSRAHDDADGDGSNVAKAFAEKVQGVMVEYNGKGTPVSYEVALAEAATRFPDLARAYAERPIPSA